MHGKCKRCSRFEHFGLLWRAVRFALELSIPASVSHGCKGGASSRWVEQGVGTARTLLDVGVQVKGKH
jgi:hypothetical protein